MNKGASCGRAEQRHIQCHVRVKIASPVYGNWMLASPCRNASADGAAMSEGSRSFNSLMVYGKKEYWKTKILALGWMYFWLWPLKESMFLLLLIVVSNRDVHNKCDNVIKYQYMCSCPSLMQCIPL